MTSTPATAAYTDEAGEILLDVRGLSVDYLSDRGAVHAVDDVDLRIHRGEVVGLAGESGSGKSTLAYAVTRLLRDPGIITAGEAWFYDWPTRPADADQLTRPPVFAAANGSPVPVPATPTPIDLLTNDRRVLRAVRWSRIAVVFQSALHAMNPVLKVGRLLDDVLVAHNPRTPRRLRRTRAAELLDMVGISADRLNSFPHQLSGGMRQRVMIALALALRPHLLIMDEPTTALDVVIQREILEELMALKERLGFSVLFITHDLSLLIEVADTIAVMYAGKLVERAPAQALFRSPRHPYTLGLTGSFPSLRGEKKVMTGIPGSPPDLRNVPAGCPFHPRCGWMMPECRTVEPPLLQLRDASGRREALCWLQDGLHVTPAALDAPAPVRKGRQLVVPDTAVADVRVPGQSADPEGAAASIAAAEVIR